LYDASTCSVDVSDGPRTITVAGLAAASAVRVEGFAGGDLVAARRLRL
jgi:hypothetical protein